MRVLTVRQPWAWAIVNGGKGVENRVRNIAGQYRGPLAIHAGLTFDGYSEDKTSSWEIRRAITTEEQGYPADDGQVWASECIEEDDPRYAARGAIIGVVNLRASHHAEFCTEADRRGHVCSVWAEPGVWHLELEDPRALAEPIPFRGALGIRALPADVIAAIQSQLDKTLKGVTHA